MKRIICALLFCCLLLAFSACKTDKAPKDCEADAGTGAVQAEKATDESGTQAEISDSTPSAAPSSPANIAAADGESYAPPIQDYQGNTPVKNESQAPSVTTPSTAESQKPQTEKPVNPTSSASAPTEFTEAEPPTTEPKNEAVTKMKVSVNGHNFTAALADNDAVKALIDMLKEEPVVIQMSDYAGFEKVGPLGTALPTDNSHITTNAGDIVLYNGNQIVIFYGSNSWSYTKIGKIENADGWEDALGDGDVTVTFSIDENG